MIFIFIRACRLRRRRPVPSPQPVVVWPQSHKKSFLRSLFCGSVHIASRLCGLSTYAPHAADGKRNTINIQKDKLKKLFLYNPLGFFNHHKFFDFI